jgi:hypothetical protein
MERDDRIKRDRDEAEDYLATVHTGVAFAAFVVHDGSNARPDSHFGFGRRFETSGDNPISRNTSVTPDVAAQMSSQYGIVAEIKKSLDRGQSNWLDHVRQMRKYDDKLTGWWTDNETIENSDSVILIHQSRSRAFVRLLSDAIEREEVLDGGHSSVVEFNRSNESQAYVFFRREWGQISEPNLAGRLGDGVQVPLTRVLESFSSLQFCDAEPPLVYILQVLWNDVFPAILETAESDDEGRKILPVDIREVTNELQRAYGSRAVEHDSRSAEFPKVAWIRKGLEALVACRMALPAGVPDVYKVIYHGIRGDIIERFSDLLNIPVNGSSEDHQAELFEPE